MKTDNPILKKTEFDHNAIDFNSVKPQHFLPALEFAIEEAKEMIAEIKNQSEPNFENTIVALEAATEDTTFVYNLFNNLLLANGDKEMHDISEKLMPVASKFQSDITLDHDLFEKIKVIHDKEAELDLNTEQSQLLKDTYQSFTRNGALLSDADRDKIRKIDEDLAVLSPQFSKNATQAVNDYQLVVTNVDDLAGLPASVISAAKHLAEEKGQADSWIFTLQMPSYLPFLKYAENRGLRQELATAMAKTNTEGEWNNQPLVKKTLKLREQRANILGYKNHAEYTLEKRMAEKAIYCVTGL